MALSVLRADVAAVLASVWSHTPVIADENTKATPLPDGSAFLVAEFPVAFEVPMSIGSPGSNRMGETGGIHLKLMVPVGTGSAPWVGWMETLADHFRNRDADAIQYGEVDPPIFAPKPNGNYLPLSIAVAYRVDIYR